MKRKYTVKITPKLLKTLKRFWGAYQDIEECFERNVANLEKQMEKETGIKGIEFYREGTGVIGIGNYGMWTMPLVFGEDME